MANTIPDTVLEQVSVVMQPQTDSGLTEDFIFPLPTLSQQTSPGIVYVSFTRDSPEDYTLASFQCVLKFVSKEVDPSTGEPEEEGYEDEYQLEETELAAGDYIVPSYATFSSVWDRMRDGATATETFALSAMESMKGTRTPSPGTAVSHVCGSCLRLYHRDSRHAAPGRHGGASKPDCPHTTAVRVDPWRGRKGARAVPDGLLESTRRDSRAGSPCGAGSGVRACGHGNRWLICRVLHSACRRGLSVLLDLCRTFVVNSQYLFVHESGRAGYEVTDGCVAGSGPTGERLSEPRRGEE